MPPNEIALHSAAVAVSNSATTNEDSLDTSSFHTAVALDSLGFSLLVAHNYGQALQLFKKAVAANSKYAPALYHVGYCYRKGLGVTKNDELASQYFQRAIDADSTYVPALIDLGCYLEEKQEYNQAVQCFQRAVDIDPKNILALYNLGVCYMRGRVQKQGVCGNLKTALRYFQRVFDADPKDPTILYELGQNCDRCYGEGRVLALSCFKKVIAIDPKHTGALYELGRHAGYDYKQAIQYYKRAIDIDPNNAKCLQILAHLYETGEGVSQNFEYALQYWKRIADIYPSKDNIRHVEFIRKKAEASKHLQESIDIAAAAAILNSYSQHTAQHTAKDSEAMELIAPSASAAAVNNK